MILSLTTSQMKAWRLKMAPSSKESSLFEDQIDEAQIILNSSGSSGPIEAAGRYKKYFKVVNQLYSNKKSEQYEQPTRVELAQSKVDQREYAVKIIDFAKEKKRTTIDETIAMAKLSHPNIIRYYTAWIEINERSSTPELLDRESDHKIEPEYRQSVDPFRLFIFMDYHSNSLEDKLTSGTYELQDRIRFCFELCSGLEYLRSMQIAHGDLHSGNVMIKADESIVIIDFGSFERLNEEGNAISGREVSSSHGIIEPISKWSDIYMFGCVLYNVILNQFTIKDLNDEVKLYINSMMSEILNQRPTDNESFFRNQILQKKDMTVDHMRSLLVENLVKTEKLENLVKAERLENLVKIERLEARIETLEMKENSRRRREVLDRYRAGANPIIKCLCEILQSNEVAAAANWLDPNDDLNLAFQIISWERFAEKVKEMKVELKKAKIRSMFNGLRDLARDGEHYPFASNDEPILFGHYSGNASFIFNAKFDKYKIQ